MEVLGLAKACGHLVYACDTQTNLIECHYRLGEFDEVQRRAAELLPVVVAEGMHRFECTARAFLALTLLQADSPEAALAQALAGLEAARRPGDRESLCLMHITLGQVYFALTRLDEARTHLLEGLQLGEAGEQRLMRIEAHSVLSRVLAALGDYPGALIQARVHHELERQLYQREVERRVGTLAAQTRMELMRQEAELERLRTAELTRANAALQATQRALEHQAAHDSLTGLANRAHFQGRVQQVLDALADPACAEESGCVALMFIDLDQFKAVNDTAGHRAGDQLLREMARRIQATVRGSDVVGRMGGDEFTLLLRGLAQPEEAEQVAAKVLAALREPLWIGRQQFRLSASLGYALAPHDGLNAETLQQRADLAMYHVKRSGRNGWLRYEQHLSAAENERRELERDLRGAVAAQQLSLHYQGQFCLSSGALIGFEALLRWQHPRLGAVSPDRFIPLAEESLLILEIGRWVLEEACRQAVRWNFSGRGISTSVNVSAVQFEQPNFVDVVRQALRDTGLPGGCLMLELTESMVLRDEALTQRHMAELRGLGVQVAVDDFGTGYSSLSMLHNLPFTRLKVDRSFVRVLGAHTARTDRAYLLMQVLVKLAHSLEMTVMAEGVETPEQRALLLEMGCDAAQGYGLARPLPAELAARLLDAAPAEQGAATRPEAGYPGAEALALPPRSSSGTTWASKRASTGPRMAVSST